MPRDAPTSPGHFLYAAEVATTGKNLYVYAWTRQYVFVWHDAMSVSDQLRRAIRDCGMSASELAKEVLIPQPTITRFLNGADMRSSNVDKLASYFGLALSPVKKPKK